MSIKITKKTTYIFLITIITAIVILIVLRGTSPAQQSPPFLKIISPSDGTIVHPGETVIITVEPSQGVLSAAGAMGESPIGFSNEATTAPFRLSLYIPTDITPGAYHITARGIIIPDVHIESAPLTVNVEISDLPIKLQVRPPQISFSYVGERHPLDVQGTFSDGTTRTLTESSQITYSSSNPSVAVVSQNGTITTLSPGTATVTIRYISLSVDVRLSVPPTIPGDLNGDGSVDTEDLNILPSDLGVPVSMPANKPFDPRDLNGDGVIDALDAQKLQLLCTRPRCATK